ncbi:hypothetical protein PLO_0719 [Pediococcus acidilactici NGRI 0510Q]|nr:hypothetical protein PLO_0719 [Pediococcus acidilactici NGRI 0510Q]
MDNTQAIFDKLKLELNKEDAKSFKEDFLDLHNYDQGRFFGELTGPERQLVYQYLSQMNWQTPLTKSMMSRI